jgi:hypothetical protein
MSTNADTLESLTSNPPNSIVCNQDGQGNLLISGPGVSFALTFAQINAQSDPKQYIADTYNQCKTLGYLRPNQPEVVKDGFIDPNLGS